MFKSNSIAAVTHDIQSSHSVRVNAEAMDFSLVKWTFMPSRSHLGLIHASMSLIQ